MSQPTVSQTIRDLELRLSSQLFTRNAAGVALTDAGLKLRERATPMARAANSIDSMLREFDDRAEGRVKIAAPDGVLAFWIAPRAPAFQRENPNILLSLDGGLWPEHPVRNELDISIQYDAAGFGDHVVEPLATVHYASFATRKYLDLYGEPKTQAELASHRTIQHTAVQEQRDTWDPKAEAVRTLSAFNIETNSSATVAFSILSHGGFSYLPTFCAAYFDGLVMLGEKAAASPVLYLVYDPRVARVARCAKIIAWLKEIFDPTTHPWFAQDFVHPDEFAMTPGAGRFAFEPPTA